MKMKGNCSHLKQIQEVKPNKVYQCEECTKTGSSWVHLRTCQTCGITLCCDSSPNQHASKHALQYPDHPVIASAEPGERWLWCYKHKAIKQY